MRANKKQQQQQRHHPCGPLLWLLLLLLPAAVLGISRKSGIALPVPSSIATKFLSKSFPETSEDCPNNNIHSTCISTIPRGGEISLPDDDDDYENDSNGLIVSTVRSFIKSILKFGDRNIPTVSGILRSCFKAIENITGISLLPPKQQKKKSSKKKGSKKTKSSSASEEDESKTETSSDGKKKSKSSKKKEKKKKSAALKKPSATTKSHVSSTIKSNNPNYRIQKELKEFIQSPPENLSVQAGSNIRVWVVTMVGAKNSIYEGDVYKLRISFPKQYPTVPPSVYFLKGYIPTHEHVYTNGDICLSLLGKDWRPTMTAQSIAVSILSILSSAKSKTLPMDNAAHANAKPGQYQENWVYHDDNC
jgi:ubiquitin-conjugating enzyme E2 W